MDWHSVEADGTGRSCTLAGRGGTDVEGGHRPARGGIRDVQGAAAFARGLEGPETAHRDVRLAGTDRRGQDTFGEDAGGTNVWRHKIAHSIGHERIHGEVQCVAAGWLAARICGL